jgi:hypothetical protein
VCVCVCYIYVSSCKLYYYSLFLVSLEFYFLYEKIKTQLKKKKTLETYLVTWYKMLLKVFFN